MRSRRMSAKSTKSVTSNVKSIAEPNYGPDSTVFELLLPTVCKKLHFTQSVIVKKGFQRTLDDLKKTASARKSKQISFSPQKSRVMLDTTADKPDEDLSITSLICIEPHDEPLVVTANYDTVNRLAEIEIFKLPCLPRRLIQIIALLAPYYSQLTKLSIRECHIDGHILHELIKLLPLSKITEICLDGSKVLHNNFYTLLSVKSKLMNLSLSGCKINDDICKLIALQLHYQAPAESNLLVLNLSSNHITDVGAKYLAEALRTNRFLRYLNLADNWIFDVGASSIFHILSSFPLTSEEVVAKRRRLFDYIKSKNERAFKSSNEFESTMKSIPAISKGPITKRGKKGLEVMIEFPDPFDEHAVTLKDNHSYCDGNLALCCLNLAYNNLSIISVKRLLSVLIYQDRFRLSNNCGLCRVVVEGNDLPIICSELSAISDLLFKKNLERGKFHSDSACRKSKVNQEKVM